MNLNIRKKMVERTAKGAAGSADLPPLLARPRKGQRLGYLVANGQTMPVPCVVRDFDAGAATLMVGGWLGIPDSFSLYVEPDRLRLECVISERRGNAVTVRFG